MNEEKTCNLFLWFQSIIGSHTHQTFLQSLAVLINQSGTVDAAVGHTARASQHAVARSTGEITTAAYRAIVLPFRASELQTQPKTRGEVCRTHVTDERHLIGAAEQDLHAHMETNLSIRPGCGP